MKTPLALVWALVGFASGTAQAGYHSYLEGRANVLASRIAAATRALDQGYRGSPDFPLLYADAIDLQDHAGKLQWFTTHKGAMISMEEQVNYMLDAQARLSGRLDRMRLQAPAVRTPYGGRRPAGRFAPANDPYQSDVLREQLDLIAADLVQFHRDVQPAGSGVNFPTPPAPSYDYPRYRTHGHGRSYNVVPPAPPVPSGPAFPPQTGSRTFQLRTPGSSLIVTH